MNETPRRFRAHHALAFIPAIALITAPLVANRETPHILGMPFLLGWIVVWVVMTAVVMGVILRLDSE